ncbi:MAG: CoA transferase [Deltaproteobacteria bacterium]|nr:CoA transferase [Deltaproteobacteria bacterium]
MEKEEIAQKLLLSQYRALDLTDEKGMMCGKILADLGMDVIKVELPGGDPARNIGPFYHGIPDPEKSLFWLALNLNKRGITLNLNTEDGRQIFKQLTQKVDLVIESFPVGFLERRGLGYSDLNRVNHQIILTSITGFGQTGPYKEFKAPDIVCMALGGEMNLTGDPDYPPLRIGVPQAYFHAGGEAAIACLGALWHREMTGEGQAIDVSAQDSVAWLGFYNQSVWDLSRLIMTRLGAQRAAGSGVKFRFLFPCADGFVSFLALGGETRAEAQKKLVEWMDKEGLADDFIRNFDWAEHSALKATDELSEKMTQVFKKFFLTKTKKELFDFALQYGCLLAPINTAEDILASEHFQARGFWIEVDHPELNAKITYPGFPYSFSEVPCKVIRRAPLVGEHNLEIYGREFDFSRDEIITFKSGGII